MIPEFGQMAAVVFQPLCDKYHLKMDCSEWDRVVLYNEVFALNVCHDNYGSDIYYMPLKVERVVGVELMMFLALTRKFVLAPHAQPVASYLEEVRRGLENCALILDDVGADILRGETEWMEDPRVKFQPFNLPRGCFILRLVESGRGEGGG